MKTKRLTTWCQRHYLLSNVFVCLLVCGICNVPILAYGYTDNFTSLSVNIIKPSAFLMMVFFESTSSKVFVFWCSRVVRPASRLMEIPWHGCQSLDILQGVPADVQAYRCWVIQCL